MLTKHASKLTEREWQAALYNISAGRGLPPVEAQTPAIKPAALAMSAADYSRACAQIAMGRGAQKIGN